MSISIGIGDLALLLAGEDDPEEIERYLETYRQLSRFLAAHGYPGYEEPRTLPPYAERSTLQSFPAGCLHLLRRAYVYHRNGLPLTVLPEGSAATRDPVLRAEYDEPRFPSHLVHHSDAEGFYVPIDFPVPLTAAAGEYVLGSTVGSSVQLRRELLQFAPSLDIALSDGKLDQVLAADLLDSKKQTATHPFGTERALWFLMYEAATESIKHRSVIRLG